MNELKAPGCGHRGSSFLVIVGMMIVLWIASIWFQQKLYEQTEPFYDSVSYHEKVFRVMTRTQTEGITGGWDEAVFGANTVFLPMFVAIFASPFAAPGRWFGVCFQIAELGVFLYFVDTFLCRIWKLELGRRAMVLVSFLALGCLYYTNGGMADFRMDLSLALLYGVVCLAYLLALESRRLSDYLIWGVCVGMCCLVRATAPVYLMIAFFPLVMGQILNSGFKVAVREIWKLVAGALLALSICLWFYIINLEHLHYYYFVWNTDANVKLPWAHALKHFDMVQRQLSWSFWILIGGLLSVGFFGQFKVEKRWALLQLPYSSRLAWMALAPLVLLIGRRMGLNPFVSMPTAFLLHLWIVGMIVASHDLTFWKLNRVAVTLVFFCAVAFSLGRGYIKHVLTTDGLMEAHKQVIAVIVNDAKAHSRDAVHYGAAQLVDIDPSALEAVLRFDMPAVKHYGLAMSLDGVQLMPSRLFNRPAQVNWNGIPYAENPKLGTESQQRANWLAEQAQLKIDYLLVPKPATAAQIELLSDDVVIHRYALSILSALTERFNGGWRRLPDTFHGRNGREYELWTTVAH